MNAIQLWETTMNPESRTFRKVTIENAGEADMKIKTLIRNGAFLELVEDVKFNIQWD